MSKPSWVDAPAWSEWLAQDQDGTWHWFESEPQLSGLSIRSGGFWTTYTYGDVQWARKTPCYSLWRKTLEARPK